MASLWNDIVKDWEKIPLESYKFLFSQVKERFDEVLSESISVTEKSINLTKVTVAAIAGFLGYNFKANPNIACTIILCILFLLDFICLIKLMFPKGVIFKGSPPIEIFNEYLDNPIYTQEEKITIVYYHELIRYQERIDWMNSKNNERHCYYGVALILTILVSVLTAGIILSTIF